MAKSQSCPRCLPFTFPISVSILPEASAIFSNRTLSLEHQEICQNNHPKQTKSTNKSKSYPTRPKAGGMDLHRARPKVQQPPPRLPCPWHVAAQPGYIRHGVSGTQAAKAWWCELRKCAGRTLPHSAWSGPLVAYSSRAGRRTDRNLDGSLIAYHEHLISL